MNYIYSGIYIQIVRHLHFVGERIEDKRNIMISQVYMPRLWYCFYVTRDCIFIKFAILLAPLFWFIYLTFLILNVVL